ncbi:MAG: Mu-like prophage major head subunit gpT family protein [Candidatus Eremiobacteraeota bacterium]|nr:Mu-like prophage major head subunit gpT family protein [Candidatus Eremiobacteraeota bacterium]
MPISRAQFSDIVNPALRAIFFQNLGEPREEYSKIFTVEKSKKKQEVISEVTGFSAAVEKAEGADILLDSPYQGYDYTFTHGTFGLGFVVTFEMMQDDQYNIIKRLPKALGRAMRETYETAAANVFNRAFNASYTYGDGKPLCADDHPLEAGGTGSNLLSTPADLSATSLKAALSQMRKMKGSRGEYLGLTPEVLLIPPDLEFDAYQILHSTQIAGSALNDINPIRHLYNLKPVVMTRLTDSNAWFLAAKEREELIFFWRYRPDLKDDLHLSSRDVEYNSVMRFSVGSGGWRFIIGTPGAS